MALGMGAGVGSGSMTAAAVGAIAAQHPEMATRSPPLPPPPI
jgi:F0F1-type ATP synthase membrane subunit c/vacuolar-type H+-ATPase subunit K